MKNILSKISQAFRLYYDISITSEEKSAALEDAIKALSELSGREDLRNFAAEFIGASGHNYEAEAIEKVVKNFRLTVGPGYRIIPQ